MSNVHAPSLTVFLPARPGATHTGLVVIPGGGHRELWMDHEGYHVADFLADHGIAAFDVTVRVLSTGASPGDQIRVEVRVSMPAIAVPGLEHVGAWSYSAAASLRRLNRN